MIETIALQNFKSHRSTQLTLDDSRLHALVGQNSSGKTSILQALHCLCRLAGNENSSFAYIFQYERSPEFITTIGQNQMSVTASGFWGYKDQKQWQASYTWKQNVNPPWFPIASWQTDNGERQNIPGGWKSSLASAPDPIPQALRFAVRSLTSCH